MSGVFSERKGVYTYGVARFETSLTIISIPLCLATPIYSRMMSRPSDTERVWTHFGVKSTKIDSNNSHDVIVVGREIAELLKI